MTETTSHASPTRYLHRPEGRIGYDTAGAGPLVVCLPGMGELRRTFRFLVPALTSAGYRVATLDLRGHGDSDTSFLGYDDEALASDALALIEELGGGPAVIVGNSMGAGAAVIAAADAPSTVDGLVLLGPFVRDPRTSPLLRIAMRVVLSTALIRRTWQAYLPKLYAGHKPGDFEEYRAAVHRALRGWRRRAAFSRTTRTSHRVAQSVLPRVVAPALVIMGRLDPDFTDQEGEAQWIARAVGGDVVMVDDCGHYPQSQRPDVVNPAVLAFLTGIYQA